MDQIFIPVFIYLLLPIAGLIGFIMTVRKIHSAKIAEPPVVKLFLLYVNYGGLLQTILTTLIWKWSGLASLGALYLVFVAPVVMGVIACQLNDRLAVSRLHRRIYRAALGYYAALPAAMLLAAVRL